MSISLFSSYIPFSYATINIVQIDCANGASLGNNTNFGMTLPSSTILSNILFVVATVQGPGDRTITGVNITDNQNPGQYALIGRTTDFANSMYVGIFDKTISVAGSTTVTSKYFQSGGAAQNHNLEVCIYELNDAITADYTRTFHHAEGGSVVGTQSGNLVLAGGIYNPVTPGLGPAMLYTGIDDSVSGGGPTDNFSSIGHTFSGSSTWTFANPIGGNLAFFEEADLSFVDTTFTSTQTITGFVVPNFVNGVNSFSWLYFLIIVFVPMGEIIGVMTVDRGAVLDRHALIFVFLSLLLVDSIFGVMINLVTVAMPFIFGILFAVYLWRGRG